MLTQHELLHFETFGFVILRDLFTDEEMKTLSDEFETGLAAAYDHRPFDGTERHWTMMMGPETPFFASLLDDRRFYEPAEQLYGEDAFGVGCDANQYVGDTHWHPDHRIDPKDDCFGVKFAFYLDPVDGTSGALRLIPGSHKSPFHEEVRSSLERLKLPVADVPSCICSSNPGDVLAFDMRTWHASAGGATGRRMSTCVFYNNPRTEAEEAATRKRAESSRKTPARFHRFDEPLYHPDWVANPTGNPRRRRWIERMVELGFLDR